jgi:hypothetical protein
MNLFSFRRSAATAATVPVRPAWGAGPFVLARVDGAEAFETDRTHWFAACALANAHRWSPAGTSLTRPAPVWQQAPQTPEEQRDRAIDAHLSQWHGGYADPVGQVIGAWDANRLALGIRQGLERMASIHFKDYGDSQYRFTIDGRLVPNLSGGFHRQSLPAEFVPVFAHVDEAPQGRSYFLELAAFLEEGAVRLTPTL